MTARAFMLLLGLTLLACDSLKEEDSVLSGTVGYDVYSSEPQLVALRGQSEASVVVDAAWFTVDRVVLGSSDEPEGSEVPGVGLLDHVGSQARPTVVELHPHARYCEVSIDLRPTERPPSAAPAELNDYSILLSGTHEGQAFRILSMLNRTVTLQANAAECFGLEKGFSGVVFAFDLTVWLRDLPWTKAKPNGDGSLLIDQRSPEFLGEFQGRIERCIRLYADPDGDGKLDEDRNPLAGGF